MREYIEELYGDWAEKQDKKLTEIVRCMDCKHCMAGTDSVYCNYMEHAINLDGFCAWGERMEVMR